MIKVVLLIVTAYYPNEVPGRLQRYFPSVKACEIYGDAMVQKLNEMDEELLVYYSCIPQKDIDLS